MLKDFKSAMGFEEKPKSVVDEALDECCPKLSYEQRLMGYGACFGLSFVISIGALARLVDIAKGKDPTLFVVLYTLGNVLGICGSFFLSGPKKQCKAMVDKTRIFATCFYLTSIVMTRAGINVLRPLCLGAKSCHSSNASSTRVEERPRGFVLSKKEPNPWRHGPIDTPGLHISVVGFHTGHDHLCGFLRENTCRWAPGNHYPLHFCAMDRYGVVHYLVHSVRARLGLHGVLSGSARPVV